MNRVVLFFLVSFCLILCACSSENPVQVNLLTPSGEEAIKTDIASAMQTSGHRGIYFIIEELPGPSISPPPYVALENGSSLESPNNSIGLNPTQAQFTVKTSQLDQSKPYIIRVEARDVNGTVTHRGDPDCFIDLSRPQLNTINICFKDISDPKDCISKGFQSFAQCND